MLMNGMNASVMTYFGNGVLYIILLGAIRVNPIMLK